MCIYFVLFKVNSLEFLGQYLLEKSGVDDLEFTSSLEKVGKLIWVHLGVFCMEKLFQWYKLPILCPKRSSNSLVSYLLILNQNGIEVNLLHTQK